MGVAPRILAPDTELFRDVFNASPIGIAVENLDGKCLFANPAFCSMLCFSEKELRSKHCVEFFRPEDSENEWALLQQLRAGSIIEHYETIRVTKTGKKVAVSLTISPIKDSAGRLVGFSKIAEDITGRKRAEAVVRETHRALEKQTAELEAQAELLKIFVKNVPTGVAMFDRDMRYLQVSDRWCTDYTVIDSSQMLGRSHYEVFPDLPDRWKKVHRRALEGETVQADEDRWDREGGPIWVRWEVRPWLNVQGLPGGILIFAEDITRRKQMEEALSGMSRKLIESQEQERARIGRELHDDINQRLALLAIELEQLQHNPSEVQSRLQELRERTTEISKDVEALSHELHSAKLEYLGVVGGIKSWCKEVCERQGIKIEFRNGVSSALPLGIGLCLFRVLQEALHNAIKHSGMKRVKVQLAEHANEVHLTVSDFGRGFDIDRAKQGSGLGLTSMRERVRLVRGAISIESKPWSGTTIHVRVPFR